MNDQGDAEADRQHEQAHSEPFGEVNCAPELGANVNADSVERRLADMSHSIVSKADMPKMASNWGRGLPIGTT